MGSVGYQHARSPLGQDSSRSSSPASPGTASPPYLRMHPSRAPHSPLSISTNLTVPQGSSHARSPTSPARAQTHRTLGHIPFPPPPSHANSQYHPPREHAATPPPHVNHSTLSTPPAPAAAATSGYAQSLPSPCFVHSHLDHTLHDVAKGGASGGGATGSEGQRGRKKVRSRPSDQGPSDAQVKRHLDGGMLDNLVPPSIPESGVLSGSDDEEGSDDEKNTWTRQLAETAVSVREMSRQLGALRLSRSAAKRWYLLFVVVGRARVVSHIQSVMIVTKARDNQLTRVTRELALWLMQTPRNGRDRGLIVCVSLLCSSPNAGLTGFPQLRRLAASQVEALRCRWSRAGSP